jgi:hypothetical protein
MTLDISNTIIAKSDQLNADDLMGGPITIEIVDVKIVGGDQPLELHYRGAEGKPYKPGKSMRRVLSFMWGSDGEKYLGRSMTLYRDADVRFGGDVVGGIRISHLSHIPSTITLPLTVTRGKKKSFSVKPLIVENKAEKQAADARMAANAIIAMIDKAATIEAVEDALLSKAWPRLRDAYPAEAERIISARDTRIETLSSTQE